MGRPGKAGRRGPAASGAVSRSWPADYPKRQSPAGTDGRAATLEGSGAFGQCRAPGRRRRLPGACRPGWAPHLRLLVTSQTPLHLSGERVLRVNALDVPSADASPAQASQAGAVAMFVDHARAMEHRFELTPDNVGTVVRLCARLEGI